MATRIGLGVPLPMLAPATATWAAPFAAYYVFLQNRVVYQRLSNKCYLGDNSEKGLKDLLYISSRAQLNFIENVPLALIVALVAELNGANRKYINWGLGALFLCRVSHAELGMVMARGFGYGRAVGFYGTEVVVAGFAGYLAYLVKGYWQI